MRADARRNRERLVAAATELFVEEGVDVPLDAIARRAEVGIGTLYRHFSDRHALAEAVALASFGRVRTLAHDAVRGEGRDVLHGFLARVAERRIGVLMASLYPLLSEVSRDEALVEAFDALLVAVDELVAHAQERGELRPEVVTDDVIVLLALLTQPLPGSSQEYHEAITPRLLHLLVEGLQPGPGTTAPPAAPEPPDTDDAARLRRSG